MSRLRVAIDYTSAVAQSAGVGRYTRSLTAALALQIEPDEDLVLWYASRDSDTSSTPLLDAHERVRLSRIPVSPRAATIVWQRLRLPVRIERFVGAVDVVHATDFVAPPSAAPVITTIHDLSYLIVPEMAHPRLKGYLSKAVPRTLRRSAQVIAVSETTRQDIIEHYGLSPERVTTIPNGVDSWFTPPSADAIETALGRFGLRRPYFLTVGTIEPRKNHQTLLDAFRQLNARHPEATLAIVGRPGWLSEPIVSAIQTAAQSLPVRYLRHVDDEWLPALYAGSVALTYPSWYEGFGLPVLEAMASGAPVIVSDRGALPEVVGDTALIVSPDDARGIAAAMLRVIEQPDVRQDLATRGRRRAARYTWDAAATSHLALYRSFGRD